MKLHTLDLRSRLVTFSLTGLCWAITQTHAAVQPAVSPASALETPPPLGATPAAASTPVAVSTPAGSPAASPGAAPRKKKGRDPNAPTPTPKIRQAKDIPFPLPVGDNATFLSIPQIGLEGQLLSKMLAAKAKRIDNEHVEIEKLHMDLNKPDGKEDFHIEMPTSMFDLKTHIISSKDPVVVTTQDFSLTGEKMEFDTVERTGKLIGNVRMIVHNLKQVAGQDDAPAPQTK